MNHQSNCKYHSQCKVSINEPARDPTTVDGDTRSAAIEDVRPEEIAAAGVGCVGIHGRVELLKIEADHAHRRCRQSRKALKNRMVDDFLEGDLEVCEVGAVHLEGVRQ